MAIVVISPKEIDIWIKALKEVDASLDIRAFPNDTGKKDIDFALTWRHPYGIFKEYPNLKCISSMGAGVDHLLKDPDLPRQAALTRLVDPYLAQDMTEFVLALCMNHLRDLYSFKIKQTQSIWKPGRYLRIEDVRVGVMGMGEIGGRVAEGLQKVGFKVQGWTRTKKNHSNILIYAGKEGFSEFLSSTDILVCVLPLTQETEGILNRKTFECLPKDAFIINVGRGAHVVDQDLLDMIAEGHLSGASLDVFHTEPLPASNALWKHPRINITPHIASITYPESVAPQIVENYYRMKDNKPLLNLVSREKGY
ncbi:MAG: glyoxylate/hydroxypyruvate reductase A [Cyclobacteriaceae bacterium]